MTHILEHSSGTWIMDGQRPGKVLSYRSVGAPDIIPKDYSPEAQALRELGIGRPYIEAAAEHARANGTSVVEELLATGAVREDAFYGALARALRLPFVDVIPPGSVVDNSTLDVQLRRPTNLRIIRSQKPPVTVVAPEVMRIGELRSTLDRLPGLRQHLAVAAPSVIRAAVWEAGAARRLREAITGLFEKEPRFSARVVFHGRQGFYAGLGLSALVAGLVTTECTRLFLHILLSMIYTTTMLLRGRAVFSARRRHPGLPTTLFGVLPVYTVMIAVYREAEIIPQLVATLKRLDWPVSRLDIKLVCEQDDIETIAAVRKEALGPQFEVVEVPPMHPRTKPKALTYALAGARGEYLAVYDAEDRPHPQQLKEAYVRFCRANPDIACLQAPLVIGNGEESWLSAMFALEYSALFRALLPMLARHRMPLPLGGTSNHFRTDILRSAGAWDPFNVTEDADLGMRLYRLGYRSDVIERQTVEDAPNDVGIWSRQRSRWFKGWLQTWLVMMRRPSELRREMGTTAFCVFHLLIGGMLLSSLAHPLVLTFFTHSLVLMMRAPSNTLTFWQCALFVIDFVNILGSYGIFLLLGTAAMIGEEKRRIGWTWVTVPIYWLLVSAAAWRAVIELRANPFFWHKTPHKPSSPKR